MHNSYFVAFMIFQPFLYHYNALNDIASLYFAKKKKNTILLLARRKALLPYRMSL